MLGKKGIKLSLTTILSLILAVILLPVIFKFMFSIIGLFIEKPDAVSLTNFERLADELKFFDGKEKVFVPLQIDGRKLQITTFAADRACPDYCLCLCSLAGCAKKIYERKCYAVRPSIATGSIFYTLGVLQLELTREKDSLKIGGEQLIKTVGCSIRRSLDECIATPGDCYAVPIFTVLVDSIERAEIDCRSCGYAKECTDYWPAEGRKLESAVEEAAAIKNCESDPCGLGCKWNTTTRSCMKSASTKY